MTEFAEFGSREREGWADGGIVDAYIAHFVPVTDRIGHDIAQRHIRSGDHVLDLCCGQGTLTAILTETGARVVGLDFSPRMLETARKTARDADLVEGDAADMPFEDARFDKVVCNFGMMHIPDQPKALSEIRRVLKPDGEFIMATWAEPASSPAFAAVFGALKANADFSAAPPQPDLFMFSVPDRAREMMAEADLEMTGHEIVEAAWVLDQPGDLFEIFLTATVGAGMLIRSQTEETVEKIREAVSATVSEQFRDGDAFRVPVMVALITAQAR